MGATLEFKPYLPLPAVWPQANTLPSLSLSVFKCKKCPSQVTGGDQRYSAQHRYLGVCEEGELSSSSPPRLPLIPASRPGSRTTCHIWGFR